MANTFEIEVTVPEGLVAGDTFKVEVEAPAKPKKPRGVLAGIALEDMTDEQLKRERTNAKSVLYKAQKRGAAQETIDANQARVDAVVAMIESRAPQTAVAENVEEVLEGDAEEVVEIDTDTAEM